MKDRSSEWWFEKAADAVVREGKTLFRVTNELDLGISSTECDNILRSKAFQEILRLRRNLYYKELANDQTLTRAAVKGQLVFVITKLLENGLFDKAGVQIMNLAKLEGWTSDGTNVNVFSDLSSLDLQKLREKFKPAAIPVPVLKN